MAYDMKISASKSGAGAIDGVIASAIAAIVIGLVKTQIKDMDMNTENAIATLVGMGVSAAVVAAKRFIGNWMKHKDPVKPATATPAPK